MRKLVKVDFSNLESVINKQLQGYGLEVNAIVSDETEKMAKQCLEYISKVGMYSDRSGKYRKSFKIKKTGGLLNPSFVLYNTRFRLTHLLENGHATRDGGRTRAFPHWGDTEKLLEETFESNIIKGINKI